MLKEENYTTQYTVGTCSSPQEADSMLSAIRNKFGFSKMDSRVSGNDVIVDIDKDEFDDDYCQNMLQRIKNFAQNPRMVAEGKKIHITEKQFIMLQESIKEKLAAERNEVNTHPTDLQAKAGNYKMGHLTIHGFEISIENPKGSYRQGKDKDGKTWKTYMHNDYGYFNRTVGKDGDAIDVFLGPNLDSEKIFPIDQFIKGEFDETKVMMGFDSKEDAKAAYLSNYDKNWKGFKYITEVDIETFKKWLYDGYRQRKPFAKYISLTESNKSDKDMITEKFSSSIITKYAKAHGGVAEFRNGGMRDGVQAWQFGSGIDLSQVTDDMVKGSFVYDEGTLKQKSNAIVFNDGTALELSTDIAAPRKLQKPSKYGSGIGDTGDHDKTPSPWVSDGGKVDSGAKYNGFGVSNRAGESQHIRQAIQNNRNDIEYLKNISNEYPRNHEIADAQKNINNLHKYGRELRNVSEGRTIRVTESQFKVICRQMLEEKKDKDYLKSLL